MRKRPAPSATAESTLTLPHEIGDECRRRLAIDLLRRPDLLDRAAVHHHDPVGHRQRFFLVVRDHDRRHAEALLQRADFAAQPQALQRVERRQGSSSNSNPGAVASARASAMRCC